MSPHSPTRRTTTWFVLLLGAMLALTACGKDERKPDAFERFGYIRNGTCNMMDRAILTELFPRTRTYAAGDLETSRERRTIPVDCLIIKPNADTGPLLTLLIRESPDKGEPAYVLALQKDWNEGRCDRTIRWENGKYCSMKGDELSFASKVFGDRFVLVLWGNVRGPVDAATASKILDQMNQRAEAAERKEAADNN